MKVNVKTRIKYKGQEYSSVEELPPEARAAYEKTMATGGAAVSTKIVFNGQEYGSIDQMPAAERQLYHDAMKLAADSNAMGRSQNASPSWLTKRQWILVFVVAGLLLVAVLIALATR